MTNWIRRSEGERECIEAFFGGLAYAPHRHDTYTFALTTCGVQSFNYRGSLLHSTKGEAVIIHPDELHDGQAGTEIGFGYRSICIPPTEIQAVTGSRTLPFVKTGVSSNEKLLRHLRTLLSELEQPLERAEYDDALVDLVLELETLAGTSRQIGLTDHVAVCAAREYIDEHLFKGFSLADLEMQTGQNRWQLSRDFRAILGTSPYRYLTMRRIDRAKLMLIEGYSIADAAIACAFSDQSHFGRHFKKTLGTSPKIWLGALSQRDARTIVL